MSARIIVQTAIAMLVLATDAGEASAAVPCPNCLRVPTCRAVDGLVVCPPGAIVVPKPPAAAPSDCEQPAAPAPRRPAAPAEREQGDD